MTFLLYIWDLSSPSPSPSWQGTQRDRPGLLAGMLRMTESPVMPVLGAMVALMSSCAWARGAFLQSTHRPLVMVCGKAQRSLTLWSSGKRALSSPAPIHADCNLCQQLAKLGDLSSPLRRVSQSCPRPVRWLWTTSPPSRGRLSAGRQ